MAAKDRYGNNLRRGAQVKDLREDSKLVGYIVGSDGDHVLVKWDDGQEERIYGEDLKSTSRSMR